MLENTFSGFQIGVLKNLSTFKVEFFQGHLNFKMLTFYEHILRAVKAFKDTPRPIT